LTTNVRGKLDHAPIPKAWGADFNSTKVYVERVIGYWSQMFKGAEQHYSTTECEALAAKEGLVKFQPFIEGETITLVTDHSALQWAQTYENSNRRLTAWGAIFSAYAPKLEIVHRAGRVHSNVDPLSCLPQAPPIFVSLRTDAKMTIATDLDLIEAQERMLSGMESWRVTFIAWDIEDCLDLQQSVWVNTWCTPQETVKKDSLKYNNPDITKDKDGNGIATMDLAEEYWAINNPPPNVHMAMDPLFKENCINNYAKDPGFASIWKSDSSNPSN
jgi:hypothetical protein